MRQAVIQKAEEKQRRQQPNLTGIPTQMKMDFEQRSGLSFDDVRVHYNSDKPRKIGALAYTQGTQVHIGPGQERHLRHELGHVVQQKRGLVKPTIFLNGTPINDNPQMEKTADSVLEMPSEQFTRQSLSIIQCERPPTFFTYLATPSGNKFSSRQGPHTIPHIYYEVMINRLSFNDIWEMIPPPIAVFDTLQLERVQYDETWANELAQIIRTTNGYSPWNEAELKEKATKSRVDFDKRVQRYLDDYSKLYNRCDLTSQTIDKTKVVTDKKLKDDLLSLLNMHPYATYAWRGAYPRHDELKGKGESTLQILHSPKTFMTPTKIVDAVDWELLERDWHGKTDLQEFLIARLKYAVGSENRTSLQRQIKRMFEDKPVSRRSRKHPPIS